MTRQSISNMFTKSMQLFIAAVLVITSAGQLLVPAASAAPATVLNPDLEQTANNTPTCFTKAGWGDHTATWALTNDTHSGNVAQSLTIANYVSGDRKLMMTENDACAPAVTPGERYDIGMWYKSTSDRNSLTVFRHSAAGWTYWTELGGQPRAAAWTEVNATTPVVPEGTDQIAFGLSLSGNGTLITDDYSFAVVGAEQPGGEEPGGEQPGGGDVDPPVVGGELSINGGLEAGANPPQGWFLAGWGDADVDAGVTNDARTGERAYQITLDGRTEGDFKLLPAEATSPAVQPGGIYDMSVWYKSTTAANNLTIFTHTAAGWGYWTDIQTLPAAADWTQVTAQTPEIPAGVDAIAWGISLSADGTLVTDDYSTVKQGDAPEEPVDGPTALGQWEVLDYELPLRAIHSTLLKNGKILLIAGSGNSVEDFEAGTFKVSVWDPITDEFTNIETPKDMFCAGHVTLPDGRVLIQGGTSSYPENPATEVDYGGLKDSWIFDPDTNEFTATNDANEGHWYPTLTALGDGDVWMAGGLKEDTTGAVNTEHFDHQAGEWLPTDQVPQTWSFWGLYPHMFLMGDGRLFYSGGHVFGNGLPGTGASIYDPEAATIADVPGLRMKDMRDQSASVLLPPAQDQKVLITGGGNINTNTPAISLTDIIDLNQANPAYLPAPDMPGAGKMYVNATTLPDRTVLTSNGGQFNRDDESNVATAAIYDPIANAWTPVPADPIGRNYHSSAVLLPDGRVVVVGSNPGDGSFEMRVSIYTPSYLFKGERPTIAGVPAEAEYGDQFTFDVDLNGKNVRYAQLMRPMSVTHHMDSNMRLVDVPIVVQNGEATVNITDNNNMLPPGPYMLTVTDADGVPSVAEWITIK